MTYSEWIALTASENEHQRRPQPTGARRPDWMKPSPLKAFDEALLAYEQGRSTATFEQALTKYNAWLSSRAFDEMDEDPARSALMKSPKEQMEHWLKAEKRGWKRYEYRDILSDFSLAANTLIDRFPMIPNVYKNALQKTFIKSGASSEEVYCIEWYQDLEKWKARLAELGDKSSGVQSATALTISWSETNAVHRRTKHKYMHTPFNRGIEFHTISKDSFTHELLHWCTHETFKQHIETSYAHRGPEYNFLKEALTEWLKRYATRDPGTGGYPNDYQDAVKVAQRVGITEPQLANTYFAGNDVVAMTAKLIDAYKPVYEEVKGERMAAILPSATYDVGIYNNVLLHFSSRQAKGRMSKPGDDKITAAMYGGFQAHGLNDAAILAATNQSWLDGYTQWKATKKSA